MTSDLLAQGLHQEQVERRRLRWFFGGIVFAIGVLDVLSALVFKHALRDQALQALLPAQVSLGGRTGVVLVGLGLILIARGIARGKKVAWAVTCGLLLTSVCLHLVTDLDVEEALIAAWLCMGLWWMRRHFQAGSDPSSIHKGALAMTGGVIVGLLYAFPASWLLRSQLTPSVTAGRTLHHLTHSVVHSAGAYQALTGRAQWFLDSLPIIAWALILYGFIRILHPMVMPAASATGTRQAVRSQLHRWGHNPVSHLSLLQDKRYFWEGDDGLVAYRVEGRVALVLGDPICPGTHQQRVVDAFLDYCDRQDWTPAFYQTEGPEPYRRFGFSLIPIGLDAVVRLADVDLSTPQRAELRYSLRRAARAGISFAFLSSSKAWTTLADEARAVSHEWLRGKGREMAYSLGNLETLRDDPDLVVGVARDAQGRLMAFVSWLPCPARKGWTLDLMRRRPNSAPGLMDALLTASLLEAKRRGLDEVSLGLAPLALPETAPGIGAGFRIMYPRLDTFFGSRTLKRFKSKFLPSWEPRYLAVPGASVLPEVLAALLVAHYPHLRLSLATRLRIPGWPGKHHEIQRPFSTIERPSAAT